MKFTDELTLLLKARYPIIYINTIEEDRVEYIIRKNIKTSLNRSIYSWDFIDGYTNNPNNEGFAKRNPVQALELVERLTAQTPALFLLKDLVISFATFLSLSEESMAITKKQSNLLSNFFIKSLMICLSSTPFSKMLFTALNDCKNFVLLGSVQ